MNKIKKRIKKRHEIWVLHATIQVLLYSILSIQRFLSITLSGIKTRLSYMSLAIDVARLESTHLAIATAIGLKEALIVRKLSVTGCKYHPERRGL